MDVGGGPMLMALTNTPGVYQPFGNGYYELRFANGAFSGRDQAGRLWVFQKLPALFDDDFFPLASIVDSTGKNRVDFHYDVYDRFSPNPVQPPFSTSQLSMRELVLREISHSPDASGRCARYRIQFEYATFAGLNYPVPYPQLLGLDFQAGRPRPHTRILRSVRVRSNLNPSCESLILPTDRTVAQRRPRPWSYDAKLAGNAQVMGRTGLRTGRIWINPALKQGTKAFWETYWHEWMHSALTPTSGPFVGFRQSARIWFKDNSHLLNWGEEALAEYSGTGLALKSVVYPVKAGYVTGWRVAFEGTEYAGILAGSFYGRYYLNTQLDSGK